MNSIKDINQSGTITTAGGAILVAAGDSDTQKANANLVSSGTLNSDGGLVSFDATNDVTASSSINSGSGQFGMTAGRNFLSLANFNVATNGANVSMQTVDNLTLGGTVTTLGGNFSLDANTAGFGQQIKLSQNAAVTTSGGNVTILSDAGIGQDLTMASTSTINAGSGKFDFRLSGEAAITGLTTTNATDDAALFVARTIQDSGDVNADLTVNSNGNIDLRAFKYVNLNKIDYNGTTPLEIDITSGNPIASAAGVVLDIDAEAGINIDKLYARNSSLTAGLSSLMTIADGQVNNNTYLNIGDFDARIGRLDDNTLVPASWVESGDNSDFFVSASATTGIRAEDFRCTGGPSYIGDGNQVLNFTFSFNNPNVDCSGTLAYYRNPYVLVNPQQTVEQRLGSVMSDILSTNMQILQQRQVQPLVLEQLGGGNLVMNNAAQALLVDEVSEISPAAAPVQAANDNILPPISGFGVRAVSAVGAIGVSDVSFIDLLTPETAGADTGDAEDDTPVAEDETDETDGGDTPLAGAPAEIGPLSLLQ